MRINNLGAQNQYQKKEETHVRAQHINTTFIVKDIIHFRGKLNNITMINVSTISV